MQRSLVEQRALRWKTTEHATLLLWHIGGKDHCRLVSQHQGATGPLMCPFFRAERCCVEEVVGVEMHTATEGKNF